MDKGKFSSSLSQSVGQRTLAKIRRDSLPIEPTLEDDLIGITLAHGPDWFKARGIPMNEGKLTNLSQILTGKLPKGFKDLEEARSAILEMSKLEPLSKRGKEKS